jgi:O-antigen/teichoic acid export membrane protein
MISITFANLARIAQSLLRIEEKSMLYALSVVAQFSTSLILNIYFVAFLKLGVKGILIANIISQALLFTILFPYLIKRMDFRIDFQKLREMLDFSYPFIFIALSTTILSLGDRLILEKLSSRAQVGLYSLGYKISNVLKILVVDAFTLSLPIIGWKLVKDDSKPKEYFSKILTYLTFTLLWLGLIIGVFSQKIIQVFAKNPEYWEAYRVIPLLLLGVVLLGIQQLLFFILQIPKKTKHISIIIGIAALSNVLINLILIPKYHMMGAAYTTVISFVLAAVLAYLAVQKYYPIQVEHRKILTLFILAILLFWGATSATGMANSYQFLVKISAVVLYPVVLYPLKFYSIAEKRKVKEVLFRFFRKEKLSK